TALAPVGDGIVGRTTAIRGSPVCARLRSAESPMPRAARSCAALAALLTLLAASPARGGFVVYSFTSDSSDRGGSLSGSFRVDEADLLDGVLSTADVRDYAFTFTDPSGGTTQYALSGVVPDIDVDPSTGVPTGLGGFVLGDQVGDSGV